MADAPSRGNSPFDRPSRKGFLLRNFDSAPLVERKGSCNWTKTPSYQVSTTNVCASRVGGIPGFFRVARSERLDQSLSARLCKRSLLRGRLNPCM